MIAVDFALSPLRSSAPSLARPSDSAAPPLPPQQPPLPLDFMPLEFLELQMAARRRAGSSPLSRLPEPAPPRSAGEGTGQTSSRSRSSSASRSLSYWRPGAVSHRLPRGATVGRPPPRAVALEGRTSHYRQTELWWLASFLPGARDPSPGGSTGASPGF